MAAFLIVSALLALQRPDQPGVRLPEGWKVEYGPKTRSGRGALVGPSGAEISFPDFFNTGTMAEVVAAMDRKALLVDAVVGESTVHVAIDSTGLLAVSFPDGDRFSLGRFDFWRRVTSAREVAETLSIVLTRTEAERAMRQRAGAPAERVAAGETGSSQAPFRGLGFRNPSQDVLLVEKNGRLESSFTPTVELVADLPGKAAWTSRSTILGGELAVSESGDGRLAASYRAASATRPAVLRARGKSLQDAVVLVLAAIAYRAP